MIPSAFSGDICICDADLKPKLLAVPILMLSSIEDEAGKNWSRGLREDESISIDPIRILRVEGHEFVEENVGRRSQTHGGTGMSGIRFEGGIDLVKTKQISILHLM